MPYLVISFPVEYNTSEYILLQAKDSFLLRIINLITTPYFISNFSIEIPTKQPFANIIISTSKKDLKEYGAIVMDDFVSFSERQRTIFLLNQFDLKNVIQKCVAIIRIIGKMYLLRRGYTNMHGGAIAFNNKGVIILANRGEGKTTTILNSISKHGFDFVANDQIMISLNSPALKVMSFPSFVRVRESSIEYLDNIVKACSLWSEQDTLESSSLMRDVVSLSLTKANLSCNLLYTVDTRLIIQYEKSIVDNEISFTRNEDYYQILQKNFLPIRTVYSNWLLKISQGLFSNDCCDLDEFPLSISNKSITCLTVSCGKNKLNAFCDLIKTNL